MRINHNISSMVAQGRLYQVNRAMDKSIQKLSTGLRINTAADDAAGLGVSENLRTQVRGLKQALKNTQDAISMLNVADGALQEQANILQRMRELVIQAKNDTYTDLERGYMYEEFSHLMDELDRIAQATNFNGLQLFATPEAAGLDSSGAPRIYAANYPAGFNTGDYETSHATDRGTRIWTDPDNSLFGENDRSSAHHFNMMLGANYTDKDATAYEGTYQSYADRDASNMMTIQFGQMDSNSLLTPYPSGYTNNNVAGSGKSANFGDARAMWDSFAWNGNPSILYNDATYDHEDTGLDNYDGTGGVADMGLQGKLSFLLSMIDGDVEDVHDDTINNLFWGREGATGLDRISKMRAQIGAVTKRLEHSMNNAMVGITNQQYAESLIRDTDFASETAHFTRNQILTQSATAMLSQANMVPQGVLQLLG